MKLYTITNECTNQRKDMNYLTRNNALFKPSRNLSYNFRTMEFVESKDNRKLRKKPQYGFKGNTVREGPAYQLTQAGKSFSIYEHRDDRICFTCKGACIFSAFYDSTKYQKKYDGMFDPKYHRCLVKHLQESSLIPYEGGIYKSSEDYFAEAEERDRKAAQEAELGYDPESLELLSRKQKAKLKKNKLREDEAKGKEEEWMNIEYGREEFKDTLELYKNYKKDRSRLADVWFSRGFPKNCSHVVELREEDQYLNRHPNRVFIKGNRGAAYFKYRTEHNYHSMHKMDMEKRKAVKNQLIGDIRLADDNDQKPEQQLAALLGA